MLGRKKFLSEAERQAYKRTAVGRYKEAVKRNSLLYMGVPTALTLLFGTYLLAEFQRPKFEKRDKKLTEVTESEQLNIGARRRRVDLKEEYYRLQQLDIDNWEQKRVTRLPGESDNKF